MANTQNPVSQAQPGQGAFAAVKAKIFHPATRQKLLAFASLLAGESATMESFAICDQYTIQGDLFSKAVMENTEVPNPMEDAIRNMAVLDALFRAGESGGWVVPEKL